MLHPVSLEQKQCPICQSHVGLFEILKERGGSGKRPPRCCCCLHYLLDQTPEVFFRITHLSLWACRLGLGQLGKGVFGPLPYASNAQNAGRNFLNCRKAAKMLCLWFSSDVYSCLGHEVLFFQQMCGCRWYLCLLMPWTCRFRLPAERIESESQRAKPIRYDLSCFFATLCCPQNHVRLSCTYISMSWQLTTRFWQACMKISKFSLYREYKEYHAILVHFAFTLW